MTNNINFKLHLCLSSHPNRNRRVQGSDTYLRRRHLLQILAIGVNWGRHLFKGLPLDSQQSSRCTTWDIDFIKFALFYNLWYHRHLFYTIINFVSLAHLITSNGDFQWITKKLMNHRFPKVTGQNIRIPWDFIVGLIKLYKLIHIGIICTYLTKLCLSVVLWLFHPL